MNHKLVSSLAAVFVAVLSVSPLVYKTARGGLSAAKAASDNERQRKHDLIARMISEGRARIEKDPKDLYRFDLVLDVNYEFVPGGKSRGLVIDPYSLFLMIPDWLSLEDFEVSPGGYVSGRKGECSDVELWIRRKMYYPDTITGFTPADIRRAKTHPFGDWLRLDVSVDGSILTTEATARMRLPHRGLDTRQAEMNIKQTWDVVVDAYSRFTPVVSHCPRQGEDKYQLHVGIVLAQGSPDRNERRQAR